MPFQKGNKLAAGIKSGGRKGFEFEAKQYKKMLKMTDLYYGLLEKILKGKPTTEERMRFEDVRQAMGKIIDKLHANKQDITSAGEQLKPTPILDINTLKDGILHNDSDKKDSETDEKD